MTKKYKLTCLNPECNNIDRHFEDKYCCLPCADYKDNVINYDTWVILYKRQGQGFKNTMLDNVIFSKEDRWDNDDYVWTK